MERSLQQFLAVAETGSISKASKQLNVTQPTITVNIQNLEDAYQVPLFERTYRGMSLTSFGSILYEKAKIIARLEVQAVREIDICRKGHTKGIGVGCGHGWWDLFVRDAVESTVAEYKEYSLLHVENGSNLHCMWKLLAGEVIVSVGHRIPELDTGISVKFVSLFRAVDAYFVSEFHPLVGQPCSLENLENLPSINSVPIERHYREILTPSEWNENGFLSGSEKPHAYSTNSLLTCAEIVKSSMGYTTFPSDMTSSLMRLGLSPLTISEETPSHEVGIYFLSERQEDSSLVKLVDNLVSSARRYVLLRQ